MTLKVMIERLHSFGKIKVSSSSPYMTLLGFYLYKPVNTLKDQLALPNYPNVDVYSKTRG